MEIQTPLNLVLEILPNAEPALSNVLSTMHADPANNAVLPFSKINNIHFARLVLLPRANHRVGRYFPAKLILTTNFDGTDQDAQLRSLVEAGGAGLVNLLRHCVGFPQSLSEQYNEDDVYLFLRGHREKVGAFYVNTIGRTVANVDFEAKLVRALEQRLDSENWSEHDAVGVREKLIQFVKDHEELQPALNEAPQVTKAERYAGYAKLAAAALVGVILAIALLPVMIVALVLLRLHELANRSDNRRPSDQHINQLEADEDHGVHNQLSAVGNIQAGWFRSILLRIALAALQLAGRYYFNRGKLAEIETIHFARWVMIDKGQRMYFLSNYDGSPESYQDDFIERVAFGLNLIFSNGIGWPRTRFLLFKGASDEQAFKAYYRDHQVPSQVWYSAPAYHGLTAVNVANNAVIRQGLRGSMSKDECTQWLKRF